MQGFLSPPTLHHHRQRSRPRHICATFLDNVEGLPPASGSQLHLLAMRNLSIRAPSRDLILRNEPGKTASFRIFVAMASTKKGWLDTSAAREMLETYAEVVDEARAKPGLHATVDFLLRVVEEDDISFVCRLDGDYF